MVLVVAAVVPSTPAVGWLDRVGWAWGSWAALLACVLLREGNFCANGAADDLWAVFIPVGVGAVAFVWLVSRWRFGLVEQAIGVALSAAFAAVASSREGGLQVAEVVRASWVTCAGAASVAVVSALARRRA